MNLSGTSISTLEDNMRTNVISNQDESSGRPDSLQQVNQEAILNYFITRVEI